MPVAMDAPATLRARKAIMWTREDCQRLAGMGLLPERWELVQGEIVSKMGTNLPHSMAAQRILAWLMGVFSSPLLLPTCSIDVAPEDNPTSEPEPDIVLLNRPAGELSRNPVPSDIALLVEVSDTTLDHDLGPKARLYARAGIVEYWVVDLKGCRVYQHRGPEAGGYAAIEVCEDDALLSPLARPEATVAVKALALG
jgi:Uma2 family endonuclease